MYVVVMTIYALKSILTLTLPGGYPTPDVCTSAATIQAAHLHVVGEKAEMADITFECRLVI